MKQQTRQIQRYSGPEGGRTQKQNLRRSSGWGPLARAARRAARCLPGGWRLDGPLPDGPCVYVVHHQNLAGPLAALALLPGQPRPWVLHPFCGRRACFAQYYRYTFPARFGWPRPLAFLAAGLGAMLVPPLLHSLGSIPVYRTQPGQDARPDKDAQPGQNARPDKDAQPGQNTRRQDIKQNQYARPDQATRPGRDAKLRRTWQLSRQALDRGESLVICPDIDYANPAAGTGEIYQGFLSLGRDYQRRQGRPLPFVPVVCDKAGRRLLLGQPVFLEPGQPVAAQKAQAAGLLAGRLNELAALTRQPEAGRQQGKTPFPLPEKPDAAPHGAA